MKHALLGLAFAAAAACAAPQRPVPAAEQAAPKQPSSPPREKIDGVAQPLAAAPRQPSSRLREKIDALAKPLIKDLWLKGLAIAVAGPDGAEIFTYGTSGAGGAAVTPDTLFEIGSITKVFASILLADMVIRGEAQLDEPVSALLGGARVPSLDGVEISLEHLSTHSSGLPQMPSNLEPADLANPFADYTVEKMLAFLADYTLPRAPGAASEYSNFAVGLLGHALAQRAGKPFEQLVRERICEPLGMKDTAIALTEEQRARFARGHDMDGRPVHHWDLSSLAAAGGLRSTANDMLRFLRANLGEIDSPIAPALELTRKARRELGQGRDMGLGWIIGKKDGLVWHNGQTGGFHSFIGFYPEQKLGAVMLANNGTGFVDALGHAVLRVMQGKPYLFEMKGIAELPQETLARYVGSYLVAEGLTLAVALEGERLFATVTGQAPLGIYPETATEFYYRAVRAKLVFQVDAEGKVTGVVLKQNGTDTFARRLP
ncbi:MAG: serine hydrolase [Myxococcales bacterium]